MSAFITRPLQHNSSLVVLVTWHYTGKLWRSDWARIYRFSWFLEDRGKDFMSLISPVDLCPNWSPICCSIVWKVCMKSDRYWYENRYVMNSGFVVYSCVIRLMGPVIKHEAWCCWYWFPRFFSSVPVTQMFSIFSLAVYCSDARLDSTWWKIKAPLFSCN